MVYWDALKEFATHVGVAKDALHVYLAFLIQVIAAIVLRRPLSNWMPWAVALLAAMLNEVLDIRYGREPQVQEWQQVEARRDIINSIVLPTLILLLSRYLPWLFRRRENRSQEKTCRDRRDAP
jgi:hypothetical protein